MKLHLLAGVLTAAIACAIAVSQLRNPDRADEAEMRRQAINDQPQVESGQRARPLDDSDESIPVPQEIDFVVEVPGEDPLTVEWDRLSPEERILHLREHFDAALNSVRSGSTSVARAKARADAALSGLRAELYGTASGRSAHEALELELESVIERRSLAEDDDEAQR